MQPLEEVRGSQDTNDLIVFHRSFISVSNGKQLVGVPAIQTIHGIMQSDGTTIGLMSLLPF